MLPVSSPFMRCLHFLAVEDTVGEQLDSHARPRATVLPSI